MRRFNLQQGARRRPANDDQQPLTPKPEVDDPNRPETEEDGIRAEAIRRLGIVRQQEARKRAQEAK